ncbi:MAG: homoserine kinase [Gemmatimonadetes bacterium]|nr:homoserine kinase [Gemmatimonadota bacterium]
MRDSEHGFERSSLHSIEHSIEHSIVRTSAFAPGSIGNVGPGLDVLGAAVTGAGDTVVAEWHDRPGVTILEAGAPDLPTDATRHTAGVAALAVLRAATSLGGQRAGRGIGLRVHKGLPLSAGQGGSAASAVAGAAAVNALLGSPLDIPALLLASLEGEEMAAGRHLDNIAPSLMGGVVLVRSLDPIDVVSLPVPPTLRLVLAHPDQRLRTADARSVLPAEVPRGTAVHQLAQVGAMVAALYSCDLALLGRALDDRIAEPARSALLPGFCEAKAAALDAGALGASISGSGPTAFALCDGDAVALRVAEAMARAYASQGVRALVRTARIDTDGTQVTCTRSEDA